MYMFVQKREWWRALWTILHELAPKSTRAAYSNPYVATAFTRMCGMPTRATASPRSVHERNNPHDKYAVAVLPVDCHSEIVPPWRMNRQHSLDFSLRKCLTFLLLFASTDRTTTAYLSCGLFRSCFVVKPSPRQRSHTCL